LSSELLLSDFDFDLPPEQIAQTPLADRSGSRLFCARRDSDERRHAHVRDLPRLLRRGDLCVFNDARVIPARLFGTKKGSGGKVELLVVRPASSVNASAALDEKSDVHEWVCLGQASKGLKPQARVMLDHGAEAEIVESLGGGEYRVRFFSDAQNFARLLESAGQLPLPPYIRRPATADDAARYQTVYSRAGGSVAAPTAGLHFTDALLAELAAAGVEMAMVTLDVGPGTFLPVREENLSLHKMHAERYAISSAVAEQIRNAKRQGRRVVAIGTTVVRTLESATDASGDLSSLQGDTRLFIKPGFVFRQVDALMTNFHLPRSTLLMLVSALLGREKTLAIYREAVAAKYRFFSYGDAMLIE
jgi:S-adenosylmethionine:tRNA ribosyltransferase-isomerase